MVQQRAPLSERFKVLGPERFGLALVPAGVGAALLYAVLAGLGASIRITAFASVALASSAALWLSSRLPSSFDGSLRRSTLRSVLWLAVGLGAIGAMARLATFMADETVEIMPLPLPLTLTLAHQILFLALFLGIIAVLWRRTNVRPSRTLVSDEWGTG